MNRHDLLFFDRRSIDYVVHHARVVLPTYNNEHLEELFSLMGNCIPAIVCRQESRSEEWIEVGLSSFRRSDNSRLRVRTRVPLNQIEEVVTPFSVMEKAAQAAAEGSVPSKLLRLAEQNRLSIGLYGSYAMQTVTGLPYVSDSSDLDILLQGEYPDINSFSKALDGITGGIRVDAEVRLSNGYDVKLTEFLSRSQTVLGKGMHDAVLLSRQAVNDSWNL